MIGDSSFYPDGAQDAEIDVVPTPEEMAAMINDPEFKEFVADLQVSEKAVKLFCHWLVEHLPKSHVTRLMDLAGETFDRSGKISDQEATVFEMFSRIAFDHLED